MRYFYLLAKLDCVKCKMGQRLGMTEREQRGNMKGQIAELWVEMERMAHRQFKLGYAWGWKEF